MIDIEDIVLAEVVRVVRAEYPTIRMEDQYFDNPPEFPFIHIEEQFNIRDKYAVDSDQVEKFAKVTYLVNVYSNLDKGRKDEAKEIMALVDSAMSSMGFMRVNQQRLSNISDSTIYRIVARYDAKVDHEHRISRR